MPPKNLAERGSRWCYKVIRDDIESWPTSKLQNFLTELAAQPADDWMVAMCSGKAHVKIGWNARGGGTIDTVTPQGMTILRAEMGEARKCLAAAGKFHPDYPEAATEMINVVLGEGGGAEECRACFDRAVRAELDYHPAYGALLYAYLPRWVGNYESMYNFGLECAETKRYDTCIPHILADVLADIHDDGQGWSFLSNPKVFQPLQEMYEGLIANASGDERFRYASEFLGFAWQSNRWDDGRRVLDQIEGKVDRTGMAVPAKVIADRAVSGMYVLTGTNAMASGAMAAEKLAAGRRFAEAATQYESLRDGLNVAPRELVWLRGRAQELHWQEQFDRGDWVDLTPDANLSGWYVQAGTFTSSGRELSGTTAENGAMLICGFKPGTRWELHATFQIEKPTERWQR